MTTVARSFDGLAAAAASGASLLNGKEALLHTYLALTAAGGAAAGLGTGLGAAAFAGLAQFLRWDTNLHLGAAHGMFQRQLQGIAQIGTALRALAASAAGAEDIAEYIAKDIREGGAARASASSKTGTAAAPRHVGIDTGMTKLIVRAALLRVGEHFIRLADFLELALSSFIVEVAIRVEFHGQSAGGLFDIGFRGIARHTQHFVIITLRHADPYHP